MGRKTVSRTPLGQRLTAVREALGYSERKKFAVQLGIHAENLGGYERGDVRPDFDLLEVYKQMFSVNPDWLLTGDGEMFLLDGNDAKKVALGKVSLPSNLPDDFVRIPSFKVLASAGDGLVPVDEFEEPDDVILARSFIRRLGASPDQSQVIFAKGESMLPTIPDGSLLLVDRSKTLIDDNGVFVFRVGEGIKVKRARWRADQRIDLVSDNQLAGYPPETYTRDELAAIVPLGRVMCVMRAP